MTTDHEHDTWGPRGPYRCACVSRDARECIARRYGRYYLEEDHPDCDECCECLCHTWDDEDASCTQNPVSTTRPDDVSTGATGGGES